MSRNHPDNVLLSCDLTKARRALTVASNDLERFRIRVSTYSGLLAAAGDIEQVVIFRLKRLCWFNRPGNGRLLRRILLIPVVGGYRKRTALYRITQLGIDSTPVGWCSSVRCGWRMSVLRMRSLRRLTLSKLKRMQVPLTWKAWVDIAHKKRREEVVRKARPEAER